MAPRETLEWSQDRQLFHLLARIVDLPPKAREAFLAQQDPGLASKARELLEHGTSSEFLETDPGPLKTPILTHKPFESEGESAPRWVGPYRLLEQIGEGGMGLVFLAEQEEPVKRRVALKILRFGPIESTLRARFEAERHAMGRLDHPNIGKILDAGTTVDTVTGQSCPYFAMELLDGASIVDYCDQHALELEERLGLFIAVCRGADHAHRRLLLHRDLKPSNILVVEVDGRPVPKIIDFGIAKGLDGSLVDAAGSITGDLVVGTPAYMSPEALGAGGEVDTRSDVFSLGVLLYELLTGSRPWKTGNASPRQLIRRRHREAPERPSTRVKALATRADRETSSETPVKSTVQGVQARQLRGDLDWVALKAIDEEPSRRYGSAAELAADVERYLTGEPVTARAATATYLLSRLMRRHWRGVVAVAVILMSLVLGIVGTSVGIVRARQAEAEARAQARAALQARDEAREVASFLSGIFEASAVEGRRAQKPPSEITALELLERGAHRIDEELAAQPVTKGRLERTIGVVYRHLGLFEDARRHLTTALELWEGEPSIDPIDAAQLHLDLGVTLIRTVQPDEARHHLERTHELVEGRTEPQALSLRADVLANMSRIERRQGHFEVAEQYARDAMALHGDHPEISPVGQGIAITNLGSIFFAQQRWVDAEQEFRRALGIFEEILGPGHARRALAADNVGAAIASQGRLDEAIPMFEKALAERRGVLEPDHPQLAQSLNNLGVAYQQTERLERAEAYHREALAIRQKAHGDQHPTTAWSFDNLARVVHDLGRPEEAYRLQGQALEARRSTLGEQHLDIARSLEHLSTLALARRELEDARAYREESLGIREVHFDGDDPRLGVDHVRLGEIFCAGGEVSTAEGHIQRGLRLLESGGESHAEDLAEARSIAERCWMGSE